MQGMSTKRKPWLLLTAALGFLVFFVFSQQVMADMFSWFKKYDVHLSPAVRGTVLLDGKPLANAVVSRELHYDKEYVDRTSTDSDGNFSFPEKNIRSRKPGGLAEMRTRQVIVVQHQQKNYLLWYLTTSSIAPQQAIVQRLSSLNCDLTNDEQEHVFSNIEKPDFPHSTFSICRWAD
ncbi:DUF6795 domain-containing protein [Rheinheimera nanhaiensis]|nr:DUF6795 domain-containing protein [Rheinheimera nanhaiensis]